MKKLLTVLSVLALAITTGNFSGFLNTNIQKNYLNNLSVSQIKGPVWSMTTDKDGNIYAGSGNGYDNNHFVKGKVYKCLAGQDTFMPMTGIDGDTITSLATDKDGNIYALGNAHAKIYKCLVGETNFVNFAKINISMSNYESAIRLIITNNGDIYVGTMCQNRVNGTITTGGQLFKVNSVGIVTKVNGLTNTSGSIMSLAVTSNGTIYAGTVTDINKGNLYKSKTNGSFELVSGWSETNGEVYSLATDKNGNVYVGTASINVKGNLYKVDNKGKLKVVNSWKENNDEIVGLVIVSDGTIYVATVYPNLKSTIIYKSNGTNAFTVMRGIKKGESFWSMTTDKDDNVYVGAFEEIYKCLDGQDTFMPMLDNK